MSEKMIVGCPECQTRFVAPLEKFLPDGRKVRCAKCGHSWFQQPEQTAAQVAPTPVTEPVKPSVSAASAPADSIMDRAARVASDRAEQEGLVEASDTSSAVYETPQESTSDFATAVAGTAAAATVAGASSQVEADNVQSLDDPATPLHEREEISTPRKRKSPFRFLFYTAAAAIIAGAVGYFFKDQIAPAVPALDPPLTSWQETVDGVVSKVIPANGALQISNVGYEVDEENGDPQLRVTATVQNDSTSLKPAPKLAVKVYDASDNILEETTIMPENLATEIAADGSETYFWQLPFPPKDLDRVEVDFAE